MLLIGSLLFYATAGIEALLTIILSSVVTWLAGLLIEGTEKKNRRKRRLFLSIGVLTLTAVLMFAKLHRALNLHYQFVVPLGISYYTFSAIGYLADVYWSKEQAERNLLRMLLFLIFFPKVLEGPISKHRHLAPQLATCACFDYTQFCFGIQRMLWGYFKKLVIADRLYIFVRTVNGNVDNETGAHLLVAAVLSVIALYGDFSGCMDIVCGLSECLSLKLAENFERPFFSRNITEFWNRWHITLGVWFKDYVYMPIVVTHILKFSKKMKDRYGTFAGKAALAIPPFTVVWLLTGLWHGTGWGHIIWGVFWCVLMILTTLFEPWLKKLNGLLHIKEESFGWRLFQMTRTFVLFMIGGTSTRYSEVSKAWVALGKLFTEFHPEGFFDGSLYSCGLDRPNFLLGIVCVFILWGTDVLHEHSGSVRALIAQNNLLFRWVIYYALFFAVLIFGIYGPGYDASSFIYMQF